MLDLLKAARQAIFNGKAEDNRSGSSESDATEGISSEDDSIINQLAVYAESESATEKRNVSPRRHAAIASRKRNCNCIGKRK